MVCTSIIEFKMNFCLLVSSSDKTSSKSKTGYSPISSLMILREANFIVRIAVLCCPCDPKLLVSIPFISIKKSSLCGPTDVFFLIISLFLFNFRALKRPSSMLEVLLMSLMYLKHIFSFLDVIASWIFLPSSFSFIK